MNKMGMIEINQIGFNGGNNSNKNTDSNINSYNYNLNENDKRGFCTTDNKNKKDEQSLSDINFIKKPEYIEGKDDTSENIYINKIIQDDVYLETSAHNPFNLTFNSFNLFAGNHFKSFIKQKKFEILRDDFISDPNFIMVTNNQSIYLRILDTRDVENSENKTDYNDDKSIKVLIKLNYPSIKAYNIKTDFSVISSEYFPIMSLNFDTVSAQLFIDKITQICKICVLGSEKVFILKFINKDFFNNFSCVLDSIIRKSIGYNTNLYCIAIRKDFYKVNFLFQNLFCLF